MYVPRSLNESVMLIGSPEMCMGILGRGLSIRNSCVFDVLSWRLLSRHQVTA